VKHKFYEIILGEIWVSCIQTHLQMMLKVRRGLAIQLSPNTWFENILVLSACPFKAIRFSISWKDINHFIKSSGNKFLRIRKYRDYLETGLPRSLRKSIWSFACCTRQLYQPFPSSPPLNSWNGGNRDSCTQKWKNNGRISNFTHCHFSEWFDLTVRVIIMLYAERMIENDWWNLF
jgi:hypothetical protein